jgi:hypothetical protein
MFVFVQRSARAIERNRVQSEAESYPVWSRIERFGAGDRGQL